MTKKDFTNDTNINNLFKTIEKASEEQTQKIEETTPEEVKEIKTNEDQEKQETKKPKKEKKTEAPTKKSQIFSEVNQIVCDYLNLKSFITQKSKKEILEEMFFEDIRKTFNLDSKATEEDMKKAIDRKMKQFEEMKILFR